MIPTDTVGDNLPEPRSSTPARKRRRNTKKKKKRRKKKKKKKKEWQLDCQRWKPSFGKSMRTGAGAASTR